MILITNPPAKLSKLLIRKKSGFSARVALGFLNFFINLIKLLASKNDPQAHNKKLCNLEKSKREMSEKINIYTSSCLIHELHSLINVFLSKIIFISHKETQRYFIW